MNSSFITHQGQARQLNEDRSLIKTLADASLLLAVADGMGGHAGGDVAARIAMETLNNFDPEREAIEGGLIELMLAAKRKIREMSKQDITLAGMGTTLTAAIVRNGVAYWAHVGDSRLYLFREGVLVQVTDDHTIPAFLLRAGEIAEDEARVHPMKNMLVSCIGCGDFEIDTGSLELSPGDLLMLSTDGLHDVLSESSMESILRSETELSKKLEALVLAALAAEGKDDMTVVAVEIQT